MRARAFLVAWTLGAIAACAQPTLLECPEAQSSCALGCVDLQTDPANCGGCGQPCAAGVSCVAGQCAGSAQGACAVNNGGCSPQAMCFDPGTGSAQCACDPGFTGDGHACAACTACGSDQIVLSPCTPVMDTACMTCTACGSNQFASSPCAPGMDTVCTACTAACAAGTFEIAPCGPTNDLTCAPCNAPCATCAGTADMCTSCLPGTVPSGTTCVPALTCGDGVLQPGEQCDDLNTLAGDGCSPTCQVEPGFYCFGEGPTLCRAGGCDADPLTVLPLGPAFALDGAGTATTAGLTFSQTSTVFTTADRAYPLMIEADVVFATPDETFVGARGSGVREAASADEPATSVRGRLGPSTVDVAAGPTTIASVPGFVPSPGVPYHVRYSDDGFTALVEWLDPMIPTNSIQLPAGSTFHGAADRAFFGGGASGGITLRNLRVCSAPTLPVTAGLTARYSALESWTVPQDANFFASAWQDTGGNGNDLGQNSTTAPKFTPGLLHGLAAIDFTGGARFTSAAFPLTTDVTVFAVIQQNVPDLFGAIAHHGSRDDDWSMEQNGINTSDPNDFHWQTNNDNTNMDLTLAPNTRFVLTGRFAGNDRFFSATTFDGAQTSTSITDASHTITAGSKPLFVGTSDNNEASNAYIGEILYFARALSDAERDQVTEYLRQLWLQ